MTEKTRTKKENVGVEETTKMTVWKRIDYKSFRISKVGDGCWEIHCLEGQARKLRIREYVLIALCRRGKQEISNGKESVMNKKI